METKTIEILDEEMACIDCPFLAIVSTGGICKWTPNRVFDVDGPPPSWCILRRAHVRVSMLFQATTLDTEDDA